MGTGLSYFILNQPGGSNVPGKVDANPYMQTQPKELQMMIHDEQDPEKKALMIRALKLLNFPQVLSGKMGRVARVIRGFRVKCAEQDNPAINLPYYQDKEVDQGHEEIIDGLKSLYDNDNAQREDYNRQGLRPHRDLLDGDFLTPSEAPLGDSVKEKGDGPDPINMEIIDPPTGGDNYDDVFKY